MRPQSQRVSVSRLISWLIFLIVGVLKKGVNCLGPTGNNLLKLGAGRKKDASWEARAFGGKTGRIELVGCELLLGWRRSLSDPWLVSNQAHRVEDDDQDRSFVNEHPTGHVDVTVD